MIKKFILIIFVIGLIGLIGYSIYTNVSFVDDEIISELSSNSASDNTQIKKADVTSSVNIYLLNTVTKELEKENRNISLKELNKNPYITLLNQLQIKSENDKLSCPVPENAKILSANLENSTLVIDLSKEFLSQDISNETDKLILQSIVKTMTNLKEINNIKINIDGNTSSKLGTFDLSSTFANHSFEA